jgi:allophanate hydrolase subunit 1
MEMENMDKAEWMSIQKHHPDEVADITPSEIKLLMAYRRDMTEITKWDMWIENYLQEIRDRHDRDIAEVGREVLERETAIAALSQQKS